MPEALLNRKRSAEIINLFAVSPNLEMRYLLGENIGGY
jgi:hypothetical protein